MGLCCQLIHENPLSFHFLLVPLYILKTNHNHGTMKSYINAIVGGILFVATFCGYLFVVPHILYFHEQHYLFQFSTEYWQHSAHLHGFFYPLTTFVIQFSHIPALGAAVWSLILTAIYFMLQSIVFRLSGRHDWLQLTVLVPAYLFSCTISLNTFPDTPVKAFIWTFAGWIAAMAIGRFLPWCKKDIQFHSPQPRKTPVWHHILSILLAISFMLAGYRMWSQENMTGTLVKTERAMLEIDRHAKAGDWDKVLETCDKLLASGRKNHLAAYLRSIALFKKGMLYDHIFDLPQHFGLRALFFPWQGSKNQAEYGHYVFEELGAINSAHRWAFEAMVGWGETAATIRNLARYNIAQGRMRVAAKFINILEHTMFYRDDAAELRRNMQAGSVPSLRDAMAHVPSEPARWDNVINIGADAKYVLNNDPDNEMAKQYLMMAMLLVNNSDAFIRNLLAYYPADKYPTLPRIFEEALILYRIKAGHTVFSAMGYNISPETEQRFGRYMNESQKGNKGTYTPEMKRSYWYYVQFILPKVNHNFDRVQPQVQS